MTSINVFRYKITLGTEFRGIGPIRLNLSNPKTYEKYVVLIQSPARTYWTIDISNSNGDSDLFQFFMNKELPKDFSGIPIMTDEMLAKYLKEYDLEFPKKAWPLLE
jgi:hypothetical protein